VTEDFSKIKVGAQTPFQTFQNYLDPYLRNFGEDDLAWLAQKVRSRPRRGSKLMLGQSDDLTPFLIPALGRHYSDWTNDDSSYATALDPPPLERFRAEDITDDRLPTENIYMGPLAERLVSALAKPSAGKEVQLPNGHSDPASSSTSQPFQPATADLEMAPPPSNSAQSQPLDAPAPLDAVELEDRIKRELRFIGIFPANPQGLPGNRAKDGEIDWSTRTDDEISAELKACQRLLSEQISTNDATKAKLSERVNARLARQEFEVMRDGLEKTIETGFLKRQRMWQKKKNKDVVPPAPAAPSSSAATIKPGEKEPVEDDKIPPLPADLVQAMERRRKLIDGVYSIVFAQAEPGRFFGMPEE
jgi:transcriptional adapter 3